MKKLLIIAVPLLLCMNMRNNGLHSVENNPFDSLVFDKVIAFDYDGYPQRRIVKDGKLVEQRWIKNQVTLTVKEARKIGHIITDDETYGGSGGACFDPHLGLVYFRNDKIVAHVSICLDCNTLDSSLKIPAILNRQEATTDSTFVDRHGFSKLGRKKLNSFCKSLGFSYCKDQLDSMFD